MLQQFCFLIAEHPAANNKAKTLRRFKAHPGSAPRHDIDRYLGVPPIDELRRPDPDGGVAVNVP